MSFDEEKGESSPHPIQARLPAPPPDAADGESWAVAHETTLRQVLSARLSAPVPTVFRYRSDDPYAVCVEFRPPGEEPVVWVFARDLLTAGLAAPTGAGDVRIWPVPGHGAGPTVCLAFESPAGRALFEADAVPLRGWLARTWSLVAPGTESARLRRRWDRTIARLVQEGC